MLRTLRTQVKWILVFFLLCFVLAIPLMYGVGGGKSSRSGNEDYAVAEIDGKKLMRSQLLRSVQDYVERSGIKDVTSTDLPMIRQMVLDQMVVQEALVKEVKALGITPSKEELDRAVSGIEDQFPTKEAFMQYLQETGITMDALREQIKTQLSQQMLLEEASAAAKVNDEELQALYDSVKDFVFTVPEGFEVLAAEFNSQEAADKAYDELSSGTSWDVVLEGFSSSDITGSTGSEKPVFLKKDSLPENMAFIASMDDGQYAEPVEVASDDFIVVFRKSAKDREVTSFEDAKEQLQSMVLNQKRQELQRTFLDEISEKVDVKVLDPEIFPAEEEVVEVISEDNASGDQESEE
ncbi:MULTISPECIES: peptidylprolyl isomerase [Dethiosulfovibrio]|uniref:peptidylprolyl isomerase n=1 Tax=Dethiosulfovibrio TaxID=47054 RepID=UPI0022A7B281|nr:MULTISPECIES: SurA N-terminal domain-containing protein [Dethiosulfovibrio]